MSTHDVIPAIDEAATALRAEAEASGGILVTCFTNARGAAMALNWAMHARAAGLRPVMGMDGRGLKAALDARSLTEWRSAVALEVRLPSPRQALASAAQTSGRHELKRRSIPRDSPLAKWLVKWEGIRRLLALELGTLLWSDSDAVWLRDPLPYFRELARMHPRLDVTLAADHHLYAEAMPAERLSYAARAPPPARTHW